MQSSSGAQLQLQSTGIFYCSFANFKYLKCDCLDIEQMVFIQRQEYKGTQCQNKWNRSPY